MNAAAVRRRGVLRDAELDLALERDGWVLVPLLDAEEIASLRAGYAALAPEGEVGLAIDYSRTDREHVRAVAELLAPVWERHLPTIFSGHRAVLSTFLAKHPGEGTDMRLHREPTFIDPALGHTFNMWVPLDDTSQALGNGVMEFVPGTQRLPSWLAGHDTPELFKGYEPYLRRHAVSVDVQAGHALLFDSELLHFSGPNRTAGVRLAFGGVLAPIDAPLIHVVADGRRRRRIFEVDLCFVTDCHPNEVREFLAERYQLLAEVEEGWLLDPLDVALEVGAGEPAAPVPYAGAAPVQLEGREGRLASRSIAGAGATADVRSRAAAVHGAHRSVPGIEAAAEGAAAWLPVDELSGLLAEPGLADALGALVSGRHAALAVVVDPHARVDLDQLVGSGLTITIHEAPMVNAGVGAASGLAIAEPGRRIEVPAGESAQLWNGGPGPLWAVVEVAGDPSPDALAAATPSVRPRILVDPEAEERLARDGYAVVPVLSPDEVEALLDQRRRAVPEGGSGLAIDFMVEDRATMAASEALLAPMWAAHLPEVFVDHELIVSTFIVKHPGGGSDMGMHNEPTYVFGGEPTYNIWIPLVDVSNEADNGVLRLVLGSQDLPLGLTGYDTPALYRPYDDALRRASWGLDVPAGHGVVYDTRMLHWSDDNRSPASRPAVAASVARRSSSLVHVLATGRRGRRVFSVDRSFFVEVHPSKAEATLLADHRLVAEVDDEAVLSSEVLAGLAGVEEVPPARTVLPWDLAGHAGAAELEVRGGGWRAEVDIGPPDAPAEAPLALAGVGRSEVRGAAQVVDHLPEALSAIDGPGGAEGSVIAVGPRSRLHVEALVPSIIRGLDGAEVNVGVATIAGVATIVPGAAVDLAVGPITVWNEGPGWAWFVIAGRPAPGSHGGGVATVGRRLARRARRLLAPG